jgi:transposase-like protein
MPKRRRKFSPEFKDEAVKMVIETSHPIAEVVRELWINGAPWELVHWV